ncbi:DsrE family protein [Acetobacteraceae bacterium ESL0709]|nr:DsrE family protein [Acetobacteraceae bacterium ESL0697]MDF7677445.1 DsrE family protein [Acetobacteraceae bacterium ESL0709]
MKRFVSFSTMALAAAGLIYQASAGTALADTVPAAPESASPGTTTSGAAPSAPWEQKGFWTSPTIHNYGEIHVLDKTSYRPDPHQTYKIIFMLINGGNDPSKVNSGLDHVARTVNLYTAAGVPLSHLKIVAVVSGKATPLVMTNDAYRARYKVDNPNLPLLAELRKAGVDVTACGQAIPENHFDYSQISKDVSLSYSSLLTVSVLEQQGYGFMLF